ncbi:MAG: hypothetical protein JWO05_2136 [Gemmatimonadetes bacterium]|nr:hypothetical protein [Gemmatimonadota bacterium]
MRVSALAGAALLAMFTVQCTGERNDFAAPGSVVVGANVITRWVGAPDDNSGISITLDLDAPPAQPANAFGITVGGSGTVSSTRAVTVAVAGSIVSDSVVLKLTAAGEPTMYFDGNRGGDSLMIGRLRIDSLPSRPLVFRRSGR